MAITHRNNMHTILNIKNYFYDCANNSVFNICKHRQQWPECQVLRSIHNSKLFIGQIPFARYFAFVDCKGKLVIKNAIYKWNNKDCRVIHRRSCCGRNTKERPRNSFLNNTLPQSHWPLISFRVRV